MPRSRSARRFPLTRVPALETDSTDSFSTSDNFPTGRSLVRSRFRTRPNPSPYAAALMAAQATAEALGQLDPDSEPSSQEYEAPIEDRPQHPDSPMVSRASVTKLSVVMICFVGLFVYGIMFLCSIHLLPHFQHSLTFNITAFADIYGVEPEISTVRRGRCRNFSWWRNINPVDHNLTITIRPKCSPDLRVYRYVFVVHSEVKNAPARDAIRKSWGVDIHRQRDSEYIFLVGVDPKRQSELVEEAKTHGDILQFATEEKYGSATKMSIMMLEWGRQNLNPSCFLVKTEDDVLVNYYNFRRALETMTEVTTSFVAGNLVVNATPVREPKSRYYVSPVEYPDKTYPEFMSGSLYVVSTNAMSPLVEMAQLTPLSPMEDVFITGILTSKTGLARLSIAGINIRHRVPACDMHHHIARQFLGPDEMVEVHRVLRTTIRDCYPSKSYNSCRCVPAIQEVAFD